MYDGVINVYKEPGYTSFDVVAKLRGILKQKKIGHTGTLDPAAEGVLVVCLGKATKLCDMLTDKEKQYTATMLLGKTTDTEDTTGHVLTECDVAVTPQEVSETVLSFVGGYEQIPPMYSAIKVGGKKLYELARNGVNVERKSRYVKIHNIELVSVNLPSVTFSVSCGKGTYIRSLCRDIGEKLGCGAVMEHLVRNAVYSEQPALSFLEEDALRLSEIEQLVQSERIEEMICPVDSLFPDYPKCRVSQEGSIRLRNGNILRQKDFLSAPPEQSAQVLVYDNEGVFTAIYQYQEEKKGWKVDKMMR